MTNSEYVHKNVTVIVGRAEASRLSVIFVVKKSGGMAFSFPIPTGVFKELSVADMELFLIVAPRSPMLDAIKQAWREVEPS